GITVTDGQVEKELAKIKKERFPTPQAYGKFLEESKYTQEEVDRLVKLQILSTEIQQKVTEEAPKPDSAKIEAYYEEEKASQFTEKESRDVRVVVNPDKAKAEAAKAALLKDNSPAGWKKAAEKYSSDPTTASKGGLQPGIQEEFLPEPLKRPIFDAATNEVIGPVKVEQNYFVLEVAKLNPAKAKSLKEAEAEIIGTLEQEEQQAYFGEFIAGYQSKWESRTFCADGFEIKLCANFKGSGRPENAPPACYEEDPEVPATECPAPVTFNRPALPGTITPQQPEGEAFVQRPHPEAADAAGEQGTVVPGGGAPEGAAPEGAAPEGEAPPAGE
ncbi:MAG TPA: peptidyl-prolyl cis-trans isomerase, partial [Solirubrobacterales bacterium]|nr:peptidyl-prolyl cis-trans isomerase [Solirubrobacterales bacterium]